jgi:hypothetical protein
MVSGMAVPSGGSHFGAFQKTRRTLSKYSFYFSSYYFLTFSLNLIILVSWFIALIKLTLIATTLDYRLRP